MITELLLQMKRRGYAVRAVPAEHVDELQEGIEASHRNGMLDEGLYKEYLSEFVFRPPDSMPEARSLIVAAMRHPQVRFTFTFNDRPFRAIVPPTYLHGRYRSGAFPAARSRDRTCSTCWTSCRGTLMPC